MMDQFIAFGIVGLSTAAIYAIISSGLVVTYATTGVFNFAHGATGMMAAFAYWQLSVGWGWPVWLALPVILVVVAPLFGILVELLMRPVQGLGDAEKLVMTIALLSGLIALARWIWDPMEPRSLSSFFADRAPFHIGSATVSWHQALTMVIAIAVAPEHLPPGVGHGSTIDLYLTTDATPGSGDPATTDLIGRDLTVQSIAAPASSTSSLHSASSESLTRPRKMNLHRVRSFGETRRSRPR